MKPEQEIDFAERLNTIARRIAEVYHMSDAAAYAYMRSLSFYEILTDENSTYRKDTAEVNFERMQNEIEYGSWNCDAAAKE